MATDTDTLSRLAKAGQEHLLTFEGDLTSDERGSLLGQIEELDLRALPGLVQEYVLGDVPFEPPADLEPATYYPAPTHGPGKAIWDAAKYHALGETLIGEGKLGLFTVAGGQGTRLGYDGPKGCYPTGCVSGKSLFQLFAEQIRAEGERYGTTIPWYIMTSPQNHGATEAFFKEHGWFGLGADNVMLFRQGVMSSFDAATGRVLLADRHTIATNPDGHGGSLKALVTSGATDDMKARGVEHIAYIQVDNPHVRCVDPTFLGLHTSAPDSSGEFSSKMIPKVRWDEKVGVFCKAGGRTCVIEYSDLPDELARQTTPDGAPRFIAGSPAIHLIGVAFIEKLQSNPDFALPYHRAVKKIPHMDLETGRAVEPESPNGVKLERFVFDAIPLAQASIVYETDRVEEFAPVKNVDGADSIVSSKQLQTDRAARWLEAAGVKVPRKPDGIVDAVIEISPLTATCAEHLKGTPNLPESFEPGSTVEL
ncbi:MAG: UDP-N-acetylglucosamine/UDP-N-acetylgalactosamine diphosphorylase [Phycisphaerales bacterium]|jgi:UDP-N-acetylglucosamine/UDP-N-acetylgalactosamine diphosphorylase